MSENNQRSVSATGPDGWSVDNRGYIHGGFDDTPVFLQTKQRFNSMKTASKYADNKKDS